MKKRVYMSLNFSVTVPVDTDEDELFCILENGAITVTDASGNVIEENVEFNSEVYDTEEVDE